MGQTGGVQKKVKRQKNNDWFLWILCVSFGMIFSVSWAAAAQGETVKYDAAGKRDPFVPLVTETTREVSGVLNVESLEEIHIEGVVYDPKNGSVIIANGIFLKEGEECGNIKVLKIEPNGAVFSVNGSEGFKALYQEEATSKEKSA